MPVDMTMRWISWRDRIRNVRGLVWCNLAILIFAVGTFLWIADEVREREHQNQENRFMAALQTGEPVRPIGPPWLVSAARDITAMGSTVVLGIVVASVVGYLTLSRRHGAALFLLVASAGGLALNSGLKQAYDRERPQTLLNIVAFDTLSFPSGHAMLSATIYLTLAVLLCRLMSSRNEKLYIIGAALLLSFLIGLSRIFLGAHFPSDVIAGWAAGVVWAQLCWFAAQFINRRRLVPESHH